MTRNPILDELHAARRQILAEYDGNTAAYLRDAHKRLEASGRPIAHCVQRTIRCIGAAKSGELVTQGNVRRTEMIATDLLVEASLRYDATDWGQSRDRAAVETILNALPDRLRLAFLLIGDKNAAYAGGISIFHLLAYEATANITREEALSIGVAYFHYRIRAGAIFPLPIVFRKRFGDPILASVLELVLKADGVKTEATIAAMHDLVEYCWNLPEGIAVFRQ